MTYLNIWIAEIKGLWLCCIKNNCKLSKGDVDNTAGIEQVINTPAVPVFRARFRSWRVSTYVTVIKTILPRLVPSRS